MGETIIDVYSDDQRPALPTGRSWEARDESVSDDGIFPDRVPFGQKVMRSMLDRKAVAR
jgi:hypothetical protein